MFPRLSNDDFRAKMSTRRSCPCNGKMNYLKIFTNMWLFTCLFVTFARSADVEESQHLIPVDGRITIWNQAWHLLEASNDEPAGRDLATMLVYGGGDKPVYCRLSIQKNGAVSAFTSEFVVWNRDEPQFNADDVCTKHKMFDANTGKIINDLWISQLLRSCYPRDYEKEISFDSMLCYVGAVSNDAPGRYLTGVLDEEYAPKLVWMKKIMMLVRKFVYSDEPQKSDKIVADIVRAVSEQKSNK